MKKLTIRSLKAENKRLRELGFDLYTAIRDAAWTTDEGKPNLHHATYHMQEAADNWKREVVDRV